VIEAKALLLVVANEIELVEPIVDETVGVDGVEDILCLVLLRQHIDFVEQDHGLRDIPTSVTPKPLQWEQA
jgi:hypothetical protein